jgi:predicted N-acetyltransferase YhbS
MIRSTTRQQGNPGGRRGLSRQGCSRKPATGIAIRPADQADLDAINRVIQAAVMTWNLSERVKRLSLPSYRYDSVDLDHLDIVVAEDDRQGILGIAAWEPVAANALPAGSEALSLHGIYVDPAHHHRGIGRRLFRAAENAVCERGLGGLLVKAQAGSTGFFTAQGMQRLPVESPQAQYASRFWKPATRMMEFQD